MPTHDCFSQNAWVCCSVEQVSLPISRLVQCGLFDAEREASEFCPAVAGLAVPAGSLASLLISELTGSFDGTCLCAAAEGKETAIALKGISLPGACAPEGRRALHCYCSRGFSFGSLGACESGACAAQAKSGCATQGER
jgi:hypothetical protein